MYNLSQGKVLEVKFVKRKCFRSKICQYNHISNTQGKLSNGLVAISLFLDKSMKRSFLLRLIYKSIIYKDIHHFWVFVFGFKNYVIRIYWKACSQEDKCIYIKIHRC